MPNLTDNRQSVDLTISKTLAASDCGIVQNVVADALTVTLPAAAAGLNFVIRVQGVNAGSSVGSAANGTATLNIAATGTDTVQGFGFTPLATKGPVSSKATNQVGDEITLFGGAGGYTINSVKGVWTRQP